MQFMCFYTNKPVAAMYPITEDDFPESQVDIQSFWEKLDQVVFEKQFANFILQVCRDGLIKIHAPNNSCAKPREFFDTRRQRCHHVPFCHEGIGRLALLRSGALSADSFCVR